MKVIVKVGEVQVTIDGLDLDRRQIRRILMDCAGVSAMLTAEPEPSQPIGFTAILERLPDDMPGISYEPEE